MSDSNGNGNKKELHMKQAKEQIEQMQGQRLILLGQVYDLERGIEYLRRHMGQLTEMDKEPEKVDAS